VIANDRNVGFGAAVNQAFRDSEAPYLAALNDDTVAQAGWLEALVAAAESRPRAGMFASTVLLYTRSMTVAPPTNAPAGTLDSAGMLIAADGSSKQRGHGECSARFADAKDALFCSGSAALYRRAMLHEIGLFDEDFFLYCEDTDLGLRARWAGWECAYVADAVVEHRYSHSAGRASPLKAYYVERNRLCVVAKNFPFSMLMRVPFASVGRYFWHVVSLRDKGGKAAEFQQAGHSAAILPFLVLWAHISSLLRLPRLLAGRRRIMATRRLSVPEFRDLLREHSIGVRQVASL
jgi:GT2 family glycosyltransferase